MLCADSRESHERHLGPETPSKPGVEHLYLSGKVLDCRDLGDTQDRNWTEVTCGDVKMERKKWHLLIPLEPWKDVLGLRGSHLGNDRILRVPG